MPKIPKEKELMYLSRIRRILVINSDTSIRDIKSILASSKKNPLNLHPHYIGKLLKKIYKERTKRIDYQTLNSLLSEFQDKLSVSDKMLWNIVNNPQASDKNKIAALKEIRNNDTAFFDKCFNAGVFEKQLGKIKIEPTLSEDKKDELLEFTKNVFGYKPDSQISGNKKA